MPKEAMKLFGCPICGFRVSGAEEACPRCGTKYGSDTKFECPFCGDHVPRGAKSCPSCHVIFKEFHKETKKTVSEQSIDELLMEIIELEAHQVNKEEKKYSCPRCSWMLDGTEDRCPKCGAGFVDEVSYQCPICAATVPEDSDRCAECGTSFAEDQPALPSTEPETAAPAHVFDPEEYLGAPKPMVPETVEEVAQPEPAPVEQPPVVEERPPEPVAEPEPEPQPTPEPVPEPVVETPKEPEPEPTPEPAPAAEPPAEEPKVEAEVEKATQPPAQRKLKTRKLKAKPQE